MQLMHGFKAKSFFTPPYSTDVYNLLGLDRFFAKSCPSINLYWTQIKFPMQKLAIFRKVKEIK